MFEQIKSGTCETIYEHYPCWIPPQGFGVNVITGKLEKTDVIKRNPKADKQYWERTPLPEGWDKKRKAEIKKQAGDPDYYDLELERFREQEWRRRLCGCWFYNFGKATYITGEHYMYLNWWYLDDGYPKFRDPDRRRYYVQQYCIEDSRCAGILEASNRRSGKSYRGGLFLYEPVSRTQDVNGGIQSKTDRDASNVFKSKIVTPFRRLPDFFRPEVDKMSGTAPEKELKFTTTKQRGAKALENIGDMGLNSFINFLSSDAYSYDGWKLFRYLGDEVGKTENVDVRARHQVVKYCLRVGSKWVGKALYTTTVEQIENGDGVENFQLLWMESDPAERDKNGHTKSGLYRYFTPAYELNEFDQYGFPLIEQNKEFFLNLRKSLDHDLRLLVGEIRKNPFTENEMFFRDARRCLYDPIKLNHQLDWITWHPTLVERGNFVWENGERFTRVVWEPGKMGRWQVAQLVDHEGESNKIVKRSEAYFPNNNYAYTIGVDPFKYDATKDNRRSDCALFVYKKRNPIVKDDPYNDAFVCMYKYRASTTTVQYEDILKTAWYYGCQILFERNIDNWRHFYREHNLEGFLMKLPGENDYGLYCDGGKTVHQQLADYTEAYINEFIEKVYFPDLIKDWLDFDIGNTASYDAAMAAGYTLIAAREKLYTRNVEATRSISDYFRIHKAV